MIRDLKAGRTKAKDVKPVRKYKLGGLIFVLTNNPRLYSFQRAGSPSVTGRRLPPRIQFSDQGQSVRYRGVQE